MYIWRVLESPNESSTNRTLEPWFFQKPRVLLKNAKKNTHPITAITDCVGSWQISSRSAAERTPSEPWHSSPGGDSFNLGTCKKPSFFMAEMSFQVLPFVGITCCVYHAICGTTMFFVASRYYPMLYFDLAMAQKLGNQCLLNVLYTCYPLVI